MKVSVRPCWSQGWLKSSQAHGALSKRYLRPLWRAHAAAGYPDDGTPCKAASAWATLGIAIRSLLAALRHYLAVVKGSDRRALRKMRYAARNAGRRASGVGPLRYELHVSSRLTGLRWAYHGQGLDLEKSYFTRIKKIVEAKVVSGSLALRSGRFDPCRQASIHGSCNASLGDETRINCCMYKIRCMAGV